MLDDADFSGHRLRGGDLQRRQAHASGLTCGGADLSNEKKRPAMPSPALHEEQGADMKTVALWTLICLNAVLLAAFVSKMSKPNIANAQAARAGDYLMIPGSVVGGVNDV